MISTFEDYKNAVHRKMKPKTVKSMVKNVKGNLVSLWGIKNPRSFISTQVYLSLYKDCYGIGYTEMNKNTKSFHHISTKSFNTNTKRMRKALSQWTRKHIILGNKTDWKRASRNVDFPKVSKTPTF